MKRILLLLWVCCYGIHSFAQKEYFEGNLIYKVSFIPKVDNLSIKDVRKILSMGEQLNTIAKDGNYRQTSEYSDVFTIRKDKKIYLKFRKIDTLYYVDFSFDTTQVTGIVKKDSIYKICNYPCKTITIKTSNITRQYYYTDSLRVNPEYDKDNAVSQFNIYSKETAGAVYLYTHIEYPFAFQTDSCIHVEKKSIDDHVFDLPPLPVEKFVFASLHTTARFPGKEGAWSKYLGSNLDPKLSLKYVKISKDQSESSVTALVEFVVGEDGSISNIQVVNKNEIHSKLAEEAARVIRESPRWLPASFYGEKITSSVRQPVIFKVMR